ncbi:MULTISPECIES: response regulator [Croceitalea]|uniref:Response regulator n=1 Tax=Croceitalea vernalis TaxID=3075599 RepID=A0ABU3BF40_9FLAO|nr:MULTISPECIES: response regulator [unclassified Croceitalea]MDT0538990.1 response regulator [Croceitalea sp. P059]MDT0620778.1 response regulator [Croceitalea sp. P007]
MQTTTWIIDDDMVSQFATRYCLQQFETELAIETFSNAEDALDTASLLVKNKEALPSLIFLDLVMDEMNGWQFIEGLKKIARSIDIPEIYVLSAFANSKDRAIAKEHKNVAGYFDKPLSRISLQKVFGEKAKV